MRSGQSLSKLSELPGHVSAPDPSIYHGDNYVVLDFETLRVEVPTDTMGPVMELVGLRRGQLDEMSQRGDYSLLKFLIPSRGLIGLRTKLLNATRGTAIMHHRFDSYRRVEGEVHHQRGHEVALPIPLEVRTCTLH